MAQEESQKKSSLRVARMNLSTQTEHWDAIQEHVRAVFGKDSDTSLSALMAVRDGSLSVYGAWEGPVLRSTGTAKVVQELSGKKSLLLYSLHGDMGLEEWREATDLFCECARSLGCSYLRAATEQESVVQLADALGFTKSYTLYKEV